MARISRDQMFLDIAAIVAQRGTCPRARVGAVVVRDGRILSIGYNGAPPGQPHCDEVGCLQEPLPDWIKDPLVGCTRTIHAEANAIAWGARTGVSLASSTMYCTHSPCVACAALMASGGIERVVYTAEYRRLEGVQILNSMGITTVKFVAA